MTDEEDLLRAIRDNPEEDTPRLMYADWLDEQPRAERPLAHLIAEQIRAALVVARPVSQKPSKLAWLRPKSIKDLWRKNRKETEYAERMRLHEQSVAENRAARLVCEAFHDRIKTESVLYGLKLPEYWLRLFTPSSWSRGLPSYWGGPMSNWLWVGTEAARFPISVGITDKRPFEGSWVREGVPQSPRRWLRPRMDRMATEQERQACALPSEIFDHLPGVESYANWITYQTHIQAQEALTSACLAWARTPVQQPTEVT